MIKDFQKTAIIAGERNVSYAEMLKRIQLFSWHTPGDPGDRVLILSENREGWIYALFSIWTRKQIATPVDAGSTAHDVAYIMKDCSPVCVWTSRTKVDIVREAMKLAGMEIEVLLIEDFEHAAAPEDKAVIEYQPQDTALIIYTSGTTGSPKGVMLSFANIDANIKAVSEEVPIFNTERRTLILLPLHHVLPLVGTLVAPITRGGGVAICPSMSGPDIMDTLCRGKIAIMVGVPRLWQTLYFGIKKKIDASAVTRFLFWLCQKVGSPALSKTIFKSVRKKMGGHITYCVCGGASLDLEVGCGLRTLGLDVLEGYGMTEAAPMISFTRPGDIIPGCAGLPLPSVQCKIVENELWVKGPNIMQGYYNAPEATAVVLDKDGYLHTGDLARFDEKGRVYITGRSKEIIVLSNGKNVQPSELEFKLEQYTLQVKEAAVVQDGDLLRAIIVPQKEWAGERTDAEMEYELKRQVLEPYNRTVANYKKVMGVFVYRGELPRTRLDKLQRYKLNEIIAAGAHTRAQEEGGVEPTFREYQIIKAYLEQEKKVKVKPQHHVETDLAMDSLDKVSLQGFIEKSFGLTVKIEQMTNFKNIQEMSEYIADRRTRIDVEETDWHQLLYQSTTHLPLPNPAVTYPLVAKTFKAGFALYNRLSVKGVENIPAKGPFIVAPNHESFLDGPLAYVGFSWDMIKHCYSYATEEHVRSGVMKYLASRHNVILMERGNLKNSILKLAEVLKQGHNVIIFPEGTRTRTGRMNRFKKTFAILSKELGVPVLPVVIRGAYKALPRGTHYVLPKKIEVEYLPLIYPRESLTYQEQADLVHDAIETAKNK